MKTRKMLGGPDSPQSCLLDLPQRMASQRTNIYGWGGSVCLRERAGILRRKRRVQRREEWIRARFYRKRLNRTAPPNTCLLLFFPVGPRCHARWGENRQRPHSAHCPCGVLESRTHDPSAPPHLPAATCPQIPPALTRQRAPRPRHPRTCPPRPPMLAHLRPWFQCRRHP